MLKPLLQHSHFEVQIRPSADMYFASGTLISNGSATPINRRFDTITAAISWMGDYAFSQGFSRGYKVKLNGIISLFFTSAFC